MDANIFLYGVLRSSPQCLAFLLRCLKGDLVAVASVSVLAEANHRFMIEEALASGVIARGTAAALRQAGPAVIAALRGYEDAMRAVRDSLGRIVPLEESILAAAAVERRLWGLMTNDSILVAAMRRNGISLLASADRDFERVEGITLFAPDDL